MKKIGWLGYFRYAWLTVRHKYWVFRYGLKVGCPIFRLIMHDMCKFYPSQYPHYQRIFFGDKSNQRGFNIAWLKHQNSQDHHWEYWWQRTGHDRATPRPVNNTPLSMTRGAMLEMISDWMGASRAYDKENKDLDINNWPWLDKHWPKAIEHLHPDTITEVRKVLHRLGRKTLCP